MKTWIEHQWGKIQHTCHVSSLQRAEIEPGEEDLALSLGFISADDDKDYWYNCRSTRVQLKKNARKYKGKLTGIVCKPISNGLRIMETKRVYKEWINPSFNYDDNDDNVYKLYNAFTTVLRDYKEHAVTNPKRNFALLELLNEVT